MLCDCANRAGGVQFFGQRPDPRSSLFPVDAPFEGLDFCGTVTSSVYTGVHCGFLLAILGTLRRGHLYLVHFDLGLARSKEGIDRALTDCSSGTPLQSISKSETEVCRVLVHGSRGGNRSRGRCVSHWWRARRRGPRAGI